MWEIGFLTIKFMPLKMWTYLTIHEEELLWELPKELLIYNLRIRHGIRHCGITSFRGNYFEKWELQ